MTRPTSYGMCLLVAIRAWFPASWRLQWKTRRGTVWTPDLLLVTAVLFYWEGETLLVERFETVRDRLRAMFPTRKLGATYTGYTDAWKAWGAKIRPAASQHLRERLRAMAADRCW